MPGTFSYAKIILIMGSSLSALKKDSQLPWKPKRMLYDQSKSYL